MALLFLIQGTPHVTTFGGVKPLLLVSMVLSLSVYDASEAAVWGAVGGMLCDLLETGAVGFYALTLTLTAWGMARLMGAQMQSNFLSLAALSLGAIAALTGLHFVLFTLWLPGGGAAFLRVELPQMGLTYLFTLLLYGVNRRRKHEIL